MQTDISVCRNPKADRKCLFYIIENKINYTAAQRETGSIEHTHTHTDSHCVRCENPMKIRLNRNRSTITSSKHIKMQAWKMQYVLVLCESPHKVSERNLRIRRWRRMKFAGERNSQSKPKKKMMMKKRKKGTQHTHTNSEPNKFQTQL